MQRKAIPIVGAINQARRAFSSSFDNCFELKYAPTIRRQSGPERYELRLSRKSKKFIFKDAMYASGMDGKSNTK